MFMDLWEISKCTNVQNDNIQRYIKYPQYTWWVTNFKKCRITYDIYS